MKKIKFILFFATMLCLTVVCVSCTKPTAPEDSTTRYDLRLSLDGNTLSASQEVRFFNSTGSELDEIKFHLYPNAYREDASFPACDPEDSLCYYDGFDTGGIDIEKCFADGTASDYTLSENMQILSVPLDKPLGKGEEIYIGFQYTVTVPKTNSRFGITENGVNLANFYPQLCVFENGAFSEYPYYQNGDPFYSECADYFLEFSTTSDTAFASTGELTDSFVQDGKYYYQAEARNVRDLAVCLIDNGTVITQRVGATDVNYVYFNDPSPELSLQTAVEAVQTFGEYFGDYTLSDLNVVQTDFIHGGMEYPGLVYISSFQKDAAYRYTIVHEIAHQWWYGAVGSDPVANPWQDEGLTEFCTALFYKLNGNAAAFDAVISSAMNSYSSARSEAEKQGLTFGSMRLKSYEFDSSDIYVVSTYDRGMLMFNSLYLAMGEKAFLAALGDYFRSYNGKIAAPDDMKACFEAGKPGAATIIDNWLDDKVYAAGA